MVDRRMPCRAFSSRHAQRPVSRHSRVVLVMEATQYRSRDDLFGWDTAHGREPASSQWRLHPKTAMGSAMVIANVLVQNTLAVASRTITWSRQSWRGVSFSRSQIAFAFGDRGGVIKQRVPQFFTRRRNSSP